MKYLKLLYFSKYKAELLVAIVIQYSNYASTRSCWFTLNIYIFDATSMWQRNYLLSCIA